MSSSNEISTDKLGNRVVVMGGFITPTPRPSLPQASVQIFKDDVNGFSSISDICFVGSW
jgi:hypothetical protein